MTLSIWRYSHLILAVSSALFLIVASVTGIILAFEPISDSMQPYAVDEIENVSVAQTISAVKSEYEEALELKINAQDFVSASVITKEGSSEDIYIHPLTAKKLGVVKERSPVFSFTTNLHRSLFLKSTGRFFVGLVSLLLCLIAVTGLLLLIQRQGGFYKLFAKVKETNFEQRYHVILGRWLLIPVIIIAVTGVYLSAEKFSLLPATSIEHNWNATSSKDLTTLPVSDFEVFQNLKLKDVKNLAFPFSEDAEDYFQVSLKDKELLVHQYTGEIISEVNYPFVELASRLSMQLHTGQGSVLWSIVLLIATASILFFIYSGFAMTLKRRKKVQEVLPMPDKDECEYIILVGSETGNTYIFAKAFHKALIKSKKRVFLSSINEYSTYNNAKHLIIFTATYGDGDAPNNARNFEKLFSDIDPINQLQFSVVGFGSLLYPHYCRFAITADQFLNNHPGYTSDMVLTKINEQSQVAFRDWVHKWEKQVGVSVQLDLQQPSKRKAKQRTFKVSERTELNVDDTFLFKLQPNKNVKFQSGDLIEIIPKNEERERQYSIAKQGNEILLSIKKHKNGACSSYLNNLKIGEEISGTIQRNFEFHFPKNASSVLLISNGTGIAPFLGMIKENKNNIPVHLFWGGRTQNSFELYKEQIEGAFSQKNIDEYYIAYSREETKQYVQDLLLKKETLVIETLNQGGVIMICGSLAMQHGVLDILETIVKERLKQPLSDFENSEQLVMDCY
ncbi:PepSY domain-containing protein [Aquimarina sp. 2201CG5-10]|uniref:PepSY domain-containing protein n=1 Tax=Aquimarina callyspongiae TaxID=3098150 RepID=UPI002AB5B537|nr:PepSY domain-containing protein [Aquimarina sp. 2201CG5-10]MDY8138411.1 PepSY domain-containing protein [Aquimarina sp. 2201CG5-10]